MKELVNDLVQSVEFRRLLIVVFLVVVTREVAEIIFDFELKGWYRLIYVCIAYGFWNSMLDLITKPKKKK
tara:strand:+ start:140 stop:349 length:210 start_codon:yes stop_codon:yes gene_type:complete